MTEKRGIPNTYLRFRESYPEVAAHYEALGKSLSQLGALDSKTAALVKLALAVAQQREGGVHSAARKGLEAGLVADEMKQVALMAITTIGFSSAMAAFTWVEDIVDGE
ncbi:MAG: carboxymuconolactone decarboxylase family protein [Thermoanaerobaculia bacterium]